MFTFAGKLHINNFSCIMANVIKIKKGLDINLKGKASGTVKRRQEQVLRDRPRLL